MVRIIVGAMHWPGKGKKTKEERIQRKEELEKNILKAFEKTGLPDEEFPGYRKEYIFGYKIGRKMEAEKIARSLIKGSDYSDSCKEEIALKCCSISKLRYHIILEEEKEKAKTEEEIK
jgi:hypothetical protein